MKRFARRAFAAMALATMVCMAMPKAAAADDEVKVAIEDLPAAVAKAIDDLFPGAKLEEAEKETENGVVVYDVEIEHDGNEYEVEVTAEGVVLEIEEDGDEDEVEDAEEDDDDEQDDDDEHEDSDDD